MELMPAFSRLNGMMAVGSMAATAALGAPMKMGVMNRFAGIMTAAMASVPQTSARIACFFVLFAL